MQMMNGRIDDRSSLGLGRAVDDIVVGTGLGILLGGVGGGILTWPEWPIGFMFGMMCATPVGLAIGLVIGLLRRPPRAVAVACLCQFCGAMVLGLGLFGASTADEVGGAFSGQILGAIVGIGASVAWPATPRLRPTQCRQCGYELHGNVSGICPECGMGIPDDQLDLIRDSLSLRWSSEDDERTNR